MSGCLCKSVIVLVVDLLRMRQRACVCVGGGATHGGVGVFDDDLTPV